MAVAVSVRAGFSAAAQGGLQAALPQSDVWPVGQLCQAIAQVLDARLNPVMVQGEITGFSRAASGHCYFSLKDETGQLRCAMFRRAASGLDFAPRDGEQVLARGRLGVYEARGDLQLVVETMRRAGQGALFEQFLQLKARLQAEGLFDAARKRAPPAQPRGIGVVTSLHAAALHDVLTALRRRAPHVPVIVSPAAVQGAGAPAELIHAMNALARLHRRAAAPEKQRQPRVDVILLVRGGGAIEDLWAFNDEALARAIAASPIPVISGVGHESDFTIADFVADLRAPTPTAAAELACPDRATLLAALQTQAARLARAARHRIDTQGQRLDYLALRLGRPASALAAERLRLERHQQRMPHALRLRLERETARLAHACQRLPAASAPALQSARQRLQSLAQAWPLAAARALQAERERLTRAALRLDLLDPRHTLARGYALLQTSGGLPLTRAAQAQPGQPVRATLADGALALTVQSAEVSPAQRGG